MQAVAASRHVTQQVRTGATTALVAGHGCVDTGTALAQEDAPGSAGRAPAPSDSGQVTRSTGRT